MKIQISQHSGIFILQTTQELSLSLEEAWNYFATPANLQKITPPEISFEITSGCDGALYAGKMITYSMRIFPVVTNNWITEITQAVKKQYFIDEQRKGPYTLWHHEHHFAQVGEKVIMTDKVTYKLPLGWLGRFVAGKWVAGKLKQIFSFRYKELNKLFTAN